MAVAELACPTCGGDLRYIQEYDRHYCYDCNNYAPEGYGGGQGLACPKCGGVLSFVRDHNRYFCHKDDEYMPPEFGRDLAQAPSSTVDSSPPEEVITRVVPETGEPDTEPPIPENLDELFPSSTPLTPEEIPRTDSSTPQAAESQPQSQATETTAAPAVVPAEPVALPPLIRGQLWKAKKSALIELCRAYGLSTSNNREALRDRLLSKLDELQKARDRARSEAATAEPTIPEPTAPESTAPEAVVPEATVPEETVHEETTPEEATPSPLDLPTVTPELSAPAEPPQPSKVNLPEARVRASPPPDDVRIIEAPRIPADVVSKPRPSVASAAIPMPAAQAPVEPAPTAAPRPQEARREATVAAHVPIVVNPCPTCGRELAYVKQYDRYYCMHCKTYAPPVVKVERIAAPPAGPLACPTCGRELTFIGQFSRHYCYHCQKYAPPTAAAAPMAPPLKTEVRIEVPQGATACPTCGRDLRYIQQYDRWYCDSCAKYAPKRAKRPCPNCAGELKWIPRYRRYFCYSCNQYAPATFPPPSVARLAAARPAAASHGATATRAEARRRPSNASNAIGLAAMGVVMYIMYAIFAVFPGELGVPPDLALTPGMAFALQFIAVLFLAIGTVWGLWILNMRK